MKIEAAFNVETNHAEPYLEDDSYRIPSIRLRCEMDRRKSRSRRVRPDAPHSGPPRGTLTHKRDRFRCEWFYIKKRREQVFMSGTERN